MMTPDRASKIKAATLIIILLIFPPSVFAADTLDNALTQLGGNVTGFGNMIRPIALGLLLSLAGIQLKFRLRGDAS
jgi:uncharacterized membrane protein